MFDLQVRNVAGMHSLHVFCFVCVWWWGGVGACFLLYPHKSYVTRFMMLPCFCATVIVNFNILYMFQLLSLLLQSTEQPEVQQCVTFIGLIFDDVEGTFIDEEGQEYTVAITLLEALVGDTEGEGTAEDALVTQLPKKFDIWAKGAADCVCQRVIMTKLVAYDQMCSTE